ncbi:MAG: hypothetical protein KJZ65_05980 [Phycisphaerales bacterium]|nr:hypothetical protein [Phycisphaerales bacterium]
MLRSLSIAFVLASAAGTTHAEVIRYNFTGLVGVGNTSHPFTGVFSYENATTGTTVYSNGSGPGSLEGFRSQYPGAIIEFWIETDEGDRVTSQQGRIEVNNIQQAEAGAPLPVGLTLQAFPLTTTGSIHGVPIQNMYLAFLPVPPNFSWDELDNFFNGNAEDILHNNPSALPPDIDPTLTGSALPAELLAVFNGGLFLGTSYGGMTFVNAIWTFELAPATCPADLTGDGQLTFHDVQQFLALFSSGDPAADRTGDGLFDFFDVQDFLAAFSAGCP